MLSGSGGRPGRPLNRRLVVQNPAPPMRMSKCPFGKILNPKTVPNVSAVSEFVYSVCIENTVFIEKGCWNVFANGCMWHVSAQ